MYSELLKYHYAELQSREEGLLGWQAPSTGYGVDDKCRQEHIATFQKLVDFHKSAIEWLEAGLLQRPLCPQCGGSGALAWDVSPNEDGAILCDACNATGFLPK